MLDKALEDCDQAITIKPDYALAYSKKGYFYFLIMKVL